MFTAEQLAESWASALREVDRELDAASASEPSTTKAVLRLLRSGDRAAALGLTTVSPKTTYAGSRKMCDGRLVRADGEHVLIEVKWYWKSYWVKRGNVSKANAYVFAPLEGRDSKSMVLDLAKFRLALGAADPATHVASVIVGHSRPADDAAADLDRFRRVTGIEDGLWDAARPQTWASSRWPGYEYDVRVQMCGVSQLAAWWPGLERKLHSAGWAG